MPAKPLPEWRPQASADLLMIVADIADENPDAAQELKDEIEAKAAKLPGHPNSTSPPRASKACVRWSSGPTTLCSIARRPIWWRS